MERTKKYVISIFNYKRSEKITIEIEYQIQNILKTIKDPDLKGRKSILKVKRHISNKKNKISSTKEENCDSL